MPSKSFSIVQSESSNTRAKAAEVPILGGKPRSAQRSLRLAQPCTDSFPLQAAISNSNGDWPSTLSSLLTTFSQTGSGGQSAIGDTSPDTNAAATDPGVVWRSPLSDMQLATPEGSIVVTLSTPHGSALLSSSTQMSESAPRERRILSDIDRLADDVRRYDNARAQERRELVDNLYAIRNELRDLSEYLHNIPLHATPRPLVDKIVGGSTPVAFSLPRGHYTMTTPSNCSSPSSSSSASSIGSYFSSHHSDDVYLASASYLDFTTA